MLEGLLRGLVLWVYQLILEGVENFSSALIEVFNMDLAYFEAHVPVTADIVQIMMAAGWALLMGNLVFQAMRAMASGLGFEGEDPQILFARTFVFSFLLMANRQICNIGLTITGRVMDLVGMPDSVDITLPTESHFGLFDGTWLLVVIVGLILIFQIIRFFFEIAERYVVLATLTIMAPLAFGMGGSKSTEDIFKGWARMYGSMCVMMLMNVVFLKLLLSAMAAIPSGAGVLPWLLFVVAIARVARKVDDLVCRVGLNPARTGDPLGRGIPLMVTMAAVRGMSRTIAATMGGQGKNGKGGDAGKAGGAGRSPRPGPPPRPGGDSGQGTTRRSDHSTRSEKAAAFSAMAQSPVKAAGQSAPAGQQGAGPTSGQGGPSQKNGQPAAKGRPEGTKPPATSVGASPPPTRPPLGRRGPNAVSRQEERAQDRPAPLAGKNPLPPPNAAPSPGADSKTMLHNQVQRQSGTPTAGTAPGGKEGQSPAPTRPPIQKGGKSSQERSLESGSRKNGLASGIGESPPTARRNDPPQQTAILGSGKPPPATRRNDSPQQTATSGSGEVPPVSRRTSLPQRTVTPSSGETLPASRRNSEPPKPVLPAADSRQSSRRNGPGAPMVETVPPPSKPPVIGHSPSPRKDGISQAAVSPGPQAAPQSTGRKGAPSQPPPAKETPQPVPRRKSDPKETLSQDRPSRPPLNRERGGKP